MKLSSYILAFFLLPLTTHAQGQTDTLRRRLAELVRSKRADVGVAVLDLAKGDTVTLGGNRHYPMQSVFKFHLSLAVLDRVDKGKLTLDQRILVSKADLRPNTWSPLRDKYPGGNVRVPLREIIQYTVAQSDNNGCDLLFRLVGGTRPVHDYLQRLGVRDVSIRATEAEMDSAWDVQFTNWTTPLATVYLLQKFYRRKVLSESSTAFLWQTMVGTTTGPDRLKGKLPVGTTVAHKTGLSGTNAQGVTAATNDVGILVLPNGRLIAIAVYVANSSEDKVTNARIIADLAQVAWNYFLAEPQVIPSK